MTDGSSERGADDLLQSLAGVAVETYRMAQLAAGLIARLDAGEKARHHSKLLYQSRKVEEHLARAGIRVVDLRDQAFEPGMAATAINVADFEPNVPLIVDQVLEPVVMGPHGLIRAGTVVLRKAAG